LTCCPSGRINAGYLAIAGPANSGKSSLFNSLIGRTISPVTPGRGTTRLPLSGICHDPGSGGQVCIIDTPPLASAMGLEIMGWMDAACLVIDATRLDEDLAAPVTEGFLDLFSGRPVLLCLTHVDHFPPGFRQALVNQACLARAFAGAHAICPPRGTGVPGLLRDILRSLPPRRMLFPEGCTTLHSERFLVSEVIRTELFRVLSEEIATATAVQIEEFSMRDSKTYVRANLIVSRHSYKGMVIGRRGQTLQKITDCAAKGAEALLERTVQPDLWVKVRESWPDNPHDLLEFGYVV